MRTASLLLICVLSACQPSTTATPGSVSTLSTCASGLSACGATCVDTQNDSANCGSCGNACSSDDVCQRGICVDCDSDGDETICNGACANLQVDPRNCGACGIACGPTQICNAGACGCPSGLVGCGATCVNVQNDAHNCGACGVTCGAAQSCVNADCACPTGQAACGAACVTLATDAANCGACGHACAAGQRCTAGTCVAEQLHCGTFPTRTTVATLKARSVTSADFNADGHPDLAVAVNESSGASFLVGDVVVFLNNGNGTFGAAQHFAAGDRPMQILSADVDGDGRPDVVVSNFLSGTVSVLRNLGGGTLGAPTSYPVSNGARSTRTWGLAVTDVSGDGAPDIVATNFDLSLVATILNDGHGNFGPATYTPVNQNPINLVVADFNRDNLSDLAVIADNDKTVVILLSNGDGTYAQAAPIASGIGKGGAAGDFNGDGMPDFAFFSDGRGLGAGNLAIYLGKGDGTFVAGYQRVYSATGESAYAEAASMTGSGVLDLVTLNDTGVSTFRGKNDGTFATEVDLSGSQGIEDQGNFAIADFNGDGALDIASPTYTSVDVYLNHCR